jgi:RAB6A-GEF complex partner protein 1
MRSGSVELMTFPSHEGVMPKSQHLQIPNHRGRKTGEVWTMEWSSDGYVLAVGWQEGWAIFSVGGRCLAWGFGLDDPVDEERYGAISSILLYGFQHTEP